jgi:two-component system sensor histidine kinase/response regulator
MTTPTQNPPRIMIVDDTPQNLHVLEAMLRDQGYQVFAMPGGELALRAAARDQPDLFLLDILMPGMNGYELCSRLKADPVLQDIPVLFLSALHESWDKVRAFRAGGLDYITKPFQIEDVEARVRVHLQLHQLQRELAAHNTRLEATVCQRTQQLADAHARLAVLDQAKSDFLTIISHELRTPLNGLFGIADLLLMELPPTPTVASYRQLFEGSQQRILTLVEDALLLTQIKAAAEDYSAKTSSLDAVLRQAVAQANEPGGGAEVALQPASQPLGRVIGEPELLVRALQSLLLTASKFSAPGGTVQVTAVAAAEACEISIATSGRTIPPAELPRFFDVLAIGKTITPGGDLGLAPCLTQCLITAFGGQVAVENVAPPGIRFLVRLKRRGD